MSKNGRRTTNVHDVHHLESYTNSKSLRIDFYSSKHKVRVHLTDDVVAYLGSLLHKHAKERKRELDRLVSALRGE